MADYWKEINQPPPASTPASAEFLVPTNAKLVRQMRTGATWLFAFAALSVVNDVLRYIAAPLRMVVSLITSEYVVVVGQAVGGLGVAVGYFLSFVMIVATAIIGFFAYRFATWAFWVGIVAIALDAIVNYFVTTLAGLWPFILHLAALWFLFLGLKASRLYAQRRAEGKA